MAFLRSNAAVALAVIFVWIAPQANSTQELNQTAVIASIDAAVRYRYDDVLGFTDIEHYAVFRGGDQTHPAAEMTVKTTYRKGVGKSYDILSQSGSSLIIRFGLNPLLDNEKAINEPGNVERSWFNSANYEMKLHPGGPQQLNGRSCYVLDVTARRKAPNMINGAIWADAGDGQLAKIDGIATKSASAFAGSTHMMREYANMGGFPMSTHARAESSSLLFGRTWSRSTTRITSFRSLVMERQNSPRHRPPPVADTHTFSKNFALALYCLCDSLLWRLAA
jgi:hypothetical protein